MPFIVYIIKRISTGRLYIGQTDDTVRRLAEHNSLNRRPTNILPDMLVPVG
ncbi:MAG: GIY-YIG nuclease family protein [Sedimentisphaerales bacterium]